MLNCFVIVLYHKNYQSNHVWRNVGILLYRIFKVDLLGFILEEEDEIYHNLQQCTQIQI